MLLSYHHLVIKVSYFEAMSTQFKRVMFVLVNVRRGGNEFDCSWSIRCPESTASCSRRHQQTTTITCSRRFDSGNCQQHCRPLQYNNALWSDPQTTQVDLRVRRRVVYQLIRIPSTCVEWLYLCRVANPSTRPGHALLAQSECRVPEWCSRPIQTIILRREFITMAAR